MTSVAIIVSASSYAGELGKLPASAKDGDAMGLIVNHQDRFDEVLELHDVADTTALNERLYTFIKRFENTEIDEFLFYFSGHGEFHDDEFYYLMPDYRTSRRRQTSIINSDLDNAVRAVRPRLYAKIVDACHSGISYIKDANHINGFLQKSKPEFRDLYFMFSSQAEESSWQGKHLSYFTSAIVGSIIDHTQPTIKYKDVINYVSDEFEVTNTQKPFFVNQGSFTDVFCDVDDELKNALRKVYTPKVSDLTASEPKGVTLFDLVAKEAEAYCDQETANSILSGLQEKFSTFKLDEEFKGLFDISIFPISIKDIPQRADIGVWLSRKNETGYFAKPTIRKEQFNKKVPKTTGLAALGASLTAIGAGISEENYKYVMDYRDVVVGYQNTTPLPFEVLFMKALNKFPNIPESGCYLAPIISRTHLRMFYTFAQWEAEDWSSTKRIGKTDWQSIEVPLKDDGAINDMVSIIETAFATYIQDPIRAKFVRDQPDI